MFKFPNQAPCARPALNRFVALASCAALINALVAAPQAGAQAPAASGNVAQAPAPADIENLVAPIALYPDDLVALVLPASTNPLQIVQADRFLDKRKQDPKLQVDQDWDDSVKSLVNYPDIVKKMSADLDWTSALGEAVVANQGAVLDAVQSFRRKAQSAGNLKTDPKQVVVVEKEIIKIEPADPQVIYVPQYNPATVVVSSPYPAYGYYPAPYPSYYYPYAPGAALATGLIWGAAMGAIWSGARYGTGWGGGNNNITINRNTNINSSNIRSARASQGTAWKSDKRPGQVRSGAGRPSTGAGRFNNGRPGDVGGGARAGERGGGLQDRQAGAGGRERAGERGGGMQDRQAGAGGRERAGERGGGVQDRQAGAGGGARERSGGSRQDAAGGSRAGSSQQFGGGGSRGGGQAGARSSGSRDALGGYGSGGGARADSARGASSRGGMSHGGGMHGGGRGGGGRGGGRGR